MGVCVCGYIECVWVTECLLVDTMAHARTTPNRTFGAGDEKPIIDQQQRKTDPAVGCVYEIQAQPVHA